MMSVEKFGSDIIRIRIKGYLKNITENDNIEFNEKAIKNKNKITYSSNNIKNTIKIFDNEIILIREGNDFINTFVFNKKKSASTYLLKENNYSIELEIITSNICVDDKSIYINYKIIDTLCEYEFKIEMSDLL